MLLTVVLPFISSQSHCWLPFQGLSCLVASVNFSVMLIIEFYLEIVFSDGVGDRISDTFVGAERAFFHPLLF